MFATPIPGMCAMFLAISFEYTKVTTRSISCESEITIYMIYSVYCVDFNHSLSMLYLEEYIEQTGLSNMSLG